ncbi:hypothetical protein GCM10023333_26740 [Ferrimonas pelagia]|uniref:Uncharacterized protein n=1 Tax=Ferrimonas pelagia TaxID=1177826 RepID=A0ABP9F1L0_9GAMM
MGALGITIGAATKEAEAKRVEAEIKERLIKFMFSGLCSVVGVTDPGAISA